MGDRDALIVICWLGILFLFFFECFYRKLKIRFSRDVQPTSDLGNCREMSSTETGRFIAPISVTTSTKELGIRIEMVEEPPPSYEEAVSYAALVTKFQFSPYGDRNIRDCVVSLGSATRLQEEEEEEDDEEETEEKESGTVTSNTSNHLSQSHPHANDSNNNGVNQCNVILADSNSSNSDVVCGGGDMNPSLKTPPGETNEPKRLIL
ncbi:hypothetical protein Ocin01_02478 [Orchesella cincta]|uniref:Uncharacterized protein n=1 Tax=Orchesella cincta TaxID=48709 RepID=A0A1D2NFY3_ORCCI|nr:hypothetical protein Ocin01_02478 [Orchesella cincta]